MLFYVFIRYTHKDNVKSTKSSHANFHFFVKTLLLLRFQSSVRDQMKDMKILHSMVHLDFSYSSLYFINKQICVSTISQKKSVKWPVCIYYTDIQNCMFIKYKDEYQKSKWTIECRIFISFIWHWSELWTRKNNNVFTKKRKLAWLDYNDHTHICPKIVRNSVRFKGIFRFSTCGVVDLHQPVNCYYRA